MDIDPVEQPPVALENLFGDTPSPPATNTSTSTSINQVQNDTELAKTLAEVDEDEDEDGAGLFGDDDEDDDDAMQQDEPDEDGLTNEQRKQRERLEYMEDDQPGEVQQKEETLAQINLANIGIPSADRVWHARLPNFLSLNAIPFEESTWVPEELMAEESESQNQDGNASSPVPGSSKAAVLDENVIRWKWGSNEAGEDVKETNSRIVRWSDGSLSLQVGAELFDISSTTEPTTGTSALPSTTINSNTTSLSTFDSTRSHGLTYLVAQHDDNELIEAQASLHGTMTFRPTTLKSNTHQKLAKSIAARNVKGRAIKLTMVPQVDPDKIKLDREKAEVDKAKKASRVSKSTSNGGGPRVKKATRFYDGEDSDDEETYDAGNGSRSQPKRGRGGPLMQGDEDEEDEEEDDGFVVNDEEGEDSDGGQQEEGSADEMDETEEKIEREERRRKERKLKQKRSGGDDTPMEPAQGVRRRLVVDDDEDDE